MWTIITLASAFVAPRSPAIRSPRCSALDLSASTHFRSWLNANAGVHERYLDRVLATCDEQMIDSVQGLRVARDAGLLRQIFKPVVAIGIDKALATPDVGLAAVQVQELMKGKNDEARLAVPLEQLEVEPYWDVKSNLPINTFKHKSPLSAKIVSAKRIVGASAPGEVCHVQIDTDGKFKYWEGQSLGLIPPGVQASGKPHHVRLYSIASTRYGDDLQGRTVSLCVRRAAYWCPELKAEDPAKKGVCSNFLCDAAAGTEVRMTGPTGKVMLMPEHTPAADLIMVATGTGIAPYRGFLRRLFVEKTKSGEAFAGLAWLFLGVSTSESLLYADDWQTIATSEPQRFRVSYAISREQTKQDGGKMYVQDRMAEHAEELFERLENGAHIYFCGLKGMMPGILSMLETTAGKRGLDWQVRLNELKENGQWHVEVY